MPAKSFCDLRDLDDTGSAANPPGFGDIYDRRPDRPLGAKPAAPIRLAQAALAASACLLAWGLAIALIGIGAGVLTILGVV